MSSIVLGEERVTDEQEVSDAPQSASIQPTAKGHAWEEATLLATGGDEELNWSSYSRGSGKRSAGGFRGLILLALFAVLIPALIISFVRAVCRASTSAVTNREAGASIRRLSDSEESNEGQGSVSQLLEECASIEEELGLSLLEETDPARALDEAEEVARVAFQLYQEAIQLEPWTKLKRWQGWPFSCIRKR
ncbi:LOW QUALITY PROTEIN: uncharacterized protein EMH_0081120 [Eimeria mitis]|uniref:Transmembrane protein n=1 Tax=Eimeria mitis TaxID=44415 RepID=U6K8R9_9EIME|nr:LOW QUALITY PROTEIN: uncharacterized protein EMH_0081120 [Eimeria mitis]CDJ33236.1 hypothetical protein EMH_0081120 [Eimeria mitis]